MYASLLEIDTEGREELKHFGLSEWSIIWNNRTTRTAGRCFCERNYIELSVKFCMEYMQSNPRIIRDLILHEIAHALAWIKHKDATHGPKWVEQCHMVGANPNRLLNPFLVRP